MEVKLPGGPLRLLKMLPRDLRETVAGDLEEEYIALRARTGRVRAGAWAWWTAARLAVTFRLERATHDRGVPPIAEELRRPPRLLDALRQDVLFSLRMLRRQPGFTAVALFALALGIGANTAIFTVVDAVLWRPLPYPDAERVMQIAEQRPREGRWFGAVSPADFFDWRDEARSFSSMAAYMRRAVNLTGNGEPERLPTLAVSPGFLDALDVAPAAGRAFRPEEETYGRHRVTIVTDALWRRRFGADPALVGRTVTFDGNPYEVVGILPRSFWWPASIDALTPLALDDHDRRLRAAHFLDVIGRLRAGASEQQAHEELNVIGQRLSRAYPVENRAHAPNVRPLRDALVTDVRTAMLVLLGAVGCVLLIACANVATLLLARSVGRQKELSVRRALGASRARIIRQLLTESLVLAFLGGAVGVTLAAWSLAIFRTMMPAAFSALPGLSAIAIDERMLASTLGVSTIAGILVGVLPSLAASDRRIAGALHDTARGNTGSARARRLRATLVVLQLAFSLVLLAGAALLAVSFGRLTRVSPGFQSQQLVTVRMNLPSSRYEEDAQTVPFYEDLIERLRRTPGIQRAAVVSAPPFTGEDARLNLEIERPAVELQHPVRAYPRLISADYFSTIGVPLVRGRQFSEFDGSGAPPVAIINETAARRFWSNFDPLGGRISLGDPPRWMAIVGIVSDFRNEGLDVGPEPEVFIPERQGFAALGAGLGRSLTVVLRATIDDAATARAVGSAVAGIDPLQPVGAIRTMDAMIADSVGSQRLNVVLVSAFAVVALLLTAAGLYGVMSYLVVQRRGEIGIRLALGASPRQVCALVLREACALALVGIAIGVAGALALTRTMTSLLFEVSATDPAVYVAVSTLLAAVALGAAIEPSRRAMQEDPLTALRDA